MNDNLTTEYIVCITLLCKESEPTIICTLLDAGVSIIDKRITYCNMSVGCALLFRTVSILLNDDIFDLIDKTKCPYFSVVISSCRETKVRLGNIKRQEAYSLVSLMDDGSLRIG